MTRQRTEAEARDRQRYVQGDGPRILPYAADELPDNALEVHDRVKAVADREAKVITRDNIPEFFGTLLRHPAIFEKQTAFGLELLTKGALPPRERELAILRIAWRCGAPYEFGEHSFFAHRIGITPEEIDAVKIGAEDSCWTVLERLVLTAVDELYEDAIITDATWAGLAEHYNDQQMIELPMVIGHYQALAYLLNSIRARLHQGNDGLMAR